MSGLLVRRCCFVALLLFITYLTVTPNPDGVESGMAMTRWLASFLFGDARHDDKIAHFGAYAVLAATAYWANIRGFSGPWSPPIFLAVYGAGLEGVQALVDARSAEVLDGVANGAGALSGFAGAVILARLLNRKPA